MVNEESGWCLKKCSWFSKRKKKLMRFEVGLKVFEKKELIFWRKGWWAGGKGDGLCFG